MQIDPQASTPDAVYPYIVSIVNPRPIAWVTTVGETGVVNLAPFSFYNAFGADPPVVVFSPTLKRDGTKKDTLKNIELNGEFVIHASVESLADKINLTSKELPPDQSEVELAGLHTVASVKVKPPRIAEAPVAMECKLLQIIPVGHGPISANLVIGEIVMIHIADDLFDDRGQVDPRKLKTLARMGGTYWLKSTDLFELKRP